MNPYSRETVENWVSDFCSGDGLRVFSAGTREYAHETLVAFLVAACEARNVEPGEVEEADLKAALLEHVARLALPAGVRAETPRLCGALLEQLERDGRLGGGRAMGAYVAALREAFEETAAGKPKPIVNPGSRIGRNDPCPCGSGRKYKKCCMRE